jgi:hypothetical protein
MPVSFGMKVSACGSVRRALLWALLCVVTAVPCLHGQTLPASSPWFGRKLPRFPNEFSSLVQRLAIAERRVISLYLETDGWEERQIQPAGKWERADASEDRVVCWLNGMPGGPARFDVQEIRFTPTLGPHEEDFTFAWNGQQTRYLLRAAGVPGKTIPVHTAQITAGEANFVGSDFPDYLTGCATSAPLYERGRSSSLSTWIQDEGLNAVVLPFLHKTYSISVFPAAQEGRKYVQVQIGLDGYRSDDVILDPARGYALISCTTKSSDGELLVRSAMSLVESAPGLWWPSEGYEDEGITDVDQAKHMSRRIHFRTTRVVANDPKFDRSVFTPSIPPGWTVDDRINDERYITAPETTRQIERQLNGDVDDAHEILENDQPSR